MKIENATDANLLISTAIESHQELWDAIQNSEDYIMDYKAPFDEEKRKEQKISWSNNWNYGKGKMLVEQGVVSNVTEMFKTLSMIEILFNRKGKSKDAIFEFLDNNFLRYVIGNRIAEVFADVLENDPRFQTFITQIEYNSYMFGYSPIIRDKFTYLGKPISRKSIAFEDLTEFSDIRNFVVFDTMKAEVLLQKLEECLGTSSELIETREQEFHQYENGWIKEGMEDIFYNILSECSEIHDDVKSGTLELEAKIKEGKLKITAWEDVEKIRTVKGDTWLNININNIDIAKIYTTDGAEITETYVVASQYSENNIGCSEYLLYQKNLGEIEYTEVINIVKEFAVSAETTIQSLTGVSKQIGQESLIYDFKRNAVEDKLLLSGNLLLSTVDDLSAEEVELKVYGGVTILPPNASIAANQIRYDLNDHVNSLAFDDNELKKHSAHYNPQISLSNRPTKDEVQLKGSEHAYQKGTKIPFKLKDYSKLFTNMLRDLVEEVFFNPVDKKAQKEFMEELGYELEEFGVDEKDLKKILGEVKAIQLHAVNNDISAIQTAMPFAQNTNGRTKLIRSFLIALGFSRKDVNMFIEVVEYGNQIEQAALENSAFYNTSEVVFDSSQDNIGHLNIHFAKIDRVIKGISGGEDIVKGFNYITNALTNTAKHVEAIKTSYFFKNRYKEFAQVQKQFEKTAKQIADIINKRKQENASSGQEGMDIPPEELRKIKLLEWKAQKKEERTNYLTQLSSQRKMAEFEQKLSMKQKDSETNEEIKKQLAAVQVELEKVKTAAKLAKQ